MSKRRRDPIDATVAAAVKYLKPRRCKYCRATFIPSRPQDKDARFCEPNHRKQYWRYGGLPFDKIMERVRKELAGVVTDAVKPLENRIAALEAKRK